MWQNVTATSPSEYNVTYPIENRSFTSLWVSMDFPNPGFWGNMSAGGVFKSFTNSNTTLIKLSDYANASGGGKGMIYCLGW